MTRKRNDISNSLNLDQLAKDKKAELGVAWKRQHLLHRIDLQEIIMAESRMIAENSAELKKVSPCALHSFQVKCP